MKVSINGLLLNDKFSGVQYSTESLIQAIGKSNNSKLNFEILLSKGYKGGIKESESLKITKLKLNTENRVKRVLHEHLFLNQHLKKNKVDLYHSPTYILPYFTSVPSIVTVHDLIALEYPEYCQNSTAFYFNIFLPKSIKNATKVIAVSNKVKEDIIKRFNTPQDKIHVIYHGLDPDFKGKASVEDKLAVKTKYNLPDKFILFVGNLEPKKNLKRLILAFLKLKKAGLIEHKLVIVGKESWKYDDVFQTIREGKLDSEIIFTGYTERKHLPIIYSLSELFVFPSLYEGFGIPVLEAMARETPVLISNAGALPEISGGLFPQVDPYDEEDIANKIHILLTDKKLRAQNIEHGKNRVAHFSWEKAATETLSLYHQTINFQKVIN